MNTIRVLSTIAAAASLGMTGTASAVIDELEIPGVGGGLLPGLRVCTNYPTGTAVVNYYNKPTQGKLGRLAISFKWNSYFYSVDGVNPCRGTHAAVDVDIDERDGTASPGLAVSWSKVYRKVQSTRTFANVPKNTKKLLNVYDCIPSRTPVQQRFIITVNNIDGQYALPFTYDAKGRYVKCATRR